MDTTDILKALGQETLYIETIYLNLKIERALKGDEFTREHLFQEAEHLWREIDTEYYSFLNYLQNNHQQAA
jgi:hypothetical protein